MTRDFAADLEACDINQRDWDAEEVFIRYYPRRSPY